MSRTGDATVACLLPVTDVNRIVVSACGYAIGRMSAMVGIVADGVAENLHALTPHTVSSIIRMIDEAKAQDCLGWDCDVEDWMRLRARLTAYEPSPEPVEHTTLHGWALPQFLGAAWRCEAEQLQLQDAAWFWTHLAEQIPELILHSSFTICTIRDMLSDHMIPTGLPVPPRESIPNRWDDDQDDTWTDFYLALYDAYMKDEYGH
ncbi:hypothetical protein [Bifidobacterium cuniculi]|uniref:Uncharacterized protein n=1 Tax=Bifidobacterium cuniculi TaxID=1688 RepID=A0A087B4X7_9BIFI|nr:hypothetical protein [Bifidobacterium cuniculi]KFI66077.1 hypothetical protein BCUN_0579 [Bifidobacterium cuniculi]